ncbi:hypothetical protein C7974DRAFT_17637 [Boeremia exigua]|uniref:uncharacterized protein n=1 Tax=Boeremia exigua TaxID=749465 RepID=UPI001E8DFDE6|nr:uncharacterized protein C7974DRAFT_17637 [Boeremia exigua]KAH6644258.1 hypothetical protein C7974DRAFT_17637 [Boeremia exigua]
MSAQQEDAATLTANAAFAKFEQARKTNGKFVAKELAIRDEFRRMKRRKVELKTMRKMNGGQRAVWVHELIETTFIPYSKAWNRKFAEQIQSILPPEIRSMVYSYLLDDDTWEEYENDFMAVSSVLPPSIGHCSCLRVFHGLPRVPHFLLPEYVGVAASEIVEKVYSDDWFKEQILYGPTTKLESLVHKDAFGAGFDPAPHIRNLDLDCAVDEYRRPRTIHSGDTCQHTPYERKYIEQDRLKSHFDQLLGVVHNPHFEELVITFTQRNVRIDVLEEALEAFVDVHKAFKSAGKTMHLSWTYTSATCAKDGVHNHHRHLDKFFTEPRYTWKHQMLQFLKKLIPCMLDSHIHFLDEPSLGLSDADFVHRMWAPDEIFDVDEDFHEVSDEDSDDEFTDGSMVGDSQYGIRRYLLD